MVFYVVDESLDEALFLLAAALYVCMYVCMYVCIGIGIEMYWSNGSEMKSVWLVLEL